MRAARENVWDTRGLILRVPQQVRREQNENEAQCMIKERRQAEASKEQARGSPAGLSAEIKAKARMLIALA